MLSEAKKTFSGRSCSDDSIKPPNTIISKSNVASVLAAIISIVAFIVVRHVSNHPWGEALPAVRVDYSKFPFGRSDAPDIDVTNASSMSCKPAMCSSMFMGHLKGGFLAEEAQSLVVHGEKGVGKTLLRQCMDAEHRLSVEITSKDEIEELLWTHQSEFGWKDIWTVVFTKTASALADFVTTRAAIPATSNSVQVTERLETYNMLFYLGQVLSSSPTRDSFLNNFAQHLFVQAVPATVEDTNELLAWLRGQLDINRDPPSLTQLSEDEAKELLVFTAKVIHTYLKLTLTIVVDGLDEIGTDIKTAEGEPPATIALQLKARLIDHLFKHFVEMAANKQLSILYFLPKIDVSDLAKRRIVNAHHLDALRPIELKWTTAQVWAAARERFDQWIAQLEAAHRLNRDPIPKYPTFDAFLHLHNKNLCRRLAFVSHSPQKFFSFMNTLSKHVESRLPTPDDISDAICQSLCSVIGADGPCTRESLPSFCRAPW